MIKELTDTLEAQGYHGRVVSIERLGDLEGAIEGHLRDGLIDQPFFDECLTVFDFKPPENLPDAQSIIIVAVSQPHIRFTFTWNQKPVGLIVPPTYMHARRTDEQVQETVTGVLRSGGFRVEPAAVPKKLLAVRSGLAAYGRNNITYVQSMGSFHRLVAFYSDLPCSEDNWQEPRMMARCETCPICLRQCPTGAIGDDRFLLRAERCIVFHNEHPSETPFPTWIDPAWHNCLVGCLLCQTPCPENKDFLGRIEDGAEFSSQETELLLKGVSADNLPPATVEKLKVSDLLCGLEVLPRNLGVLLEGV